jgi:uncharacterized membrane protein YczE
MVIATEGAAVLLGFLMGIPVEIGMLVFCLIYGPIIDYFLRELLKHKWIKSF